MSETDGGRTATALFGRSGALSIGYLPVFASIYLITKYQDTTSATLFIPAFLYISTFQNEQELPCRNEVDEPDIFSSLIAGFAWFLMVLILTPV
mmetsp:Transcript_2191/g.2266  ORF Transcript_2191/g.2266 Transcript_2191/m.2266 type:complete len:94 (-) Transcript_2191:451-732(-)